MNPTVDNDLQKAIDDITKNTNVDPVFSDPVAAPSSVPEGDSGALAEPIGPISDIKPASGRNMSRPTMPTPASAPTTMPMPPVAEPAPATEAPLPPAPKPVVSTSVADVVTESVVPEGNSMGPSEVPSDMKSVKEAALRDLAPILSKMDVEASKKFNLYKNIREELHDNSIIGDAYTAAKDISDDTERGEALLYLVESIDNM